MCRLKHSISPLSFLFATKLVQLVEVDDTEYKSYILVWKERDPLIETLQLGGSMLCSSPLSQPHASGSEPWDISQDTCFSASFWGFQQLQMDHTPSDPSTPAPPAHPWCGSSSCSAASGCAETASASAASSFCWDVLTAAGTTKAEVPAFPQGHSEYIFLTLYQQEGFRGRCRLEQVFLPASAFIDLLWISGTSVAINYLYLCLFTLDINSLSLKQR